MIKRFQIQDLVAQDTSGVVFRAVDVETDMVVAVRRFFPFGADGGGFDKDEQAAYDIAVGRLAGLHHPGLRAVICGTCDPIDGMPFLATEWIEGKSLQSFLARQPLTPLDAIKLIARALEICELLSRVLAEEGVWVETDIETIIVGSDGTGRGVTFWISPMKWLSRDDEEHSLDSIIQLTREIMGWKGQDVAESAGRGLGGWLNWLQGVSKSVSLAEARQVLDASTGMEPITPNRSQVRPAAARPAVPVKAPAGRRKRSISGTLVTILLLGLITAGLGAWVVFQKDQHELLTEIVKAKPAPPAVVKPAAADLPEVAPKVIEAREETHEAVREEPREAVAEEPHEAVRARPVRGPSVAKSDGVFSPDDPLLLEQHQREVVVEGVLREMGFSQSKATLYLFFSENAQRNDTRGAIFLKRAGPDLTESALKPLLGKKIRISGMVDVKNFRGMDRPDIVIRNRSAIKVVP